MAQEQAAEALSNLCVGHVVTNHEMLNDFLKKAGATSKQQHNFVVGQVNEGDMVLFKETEIVPAVFLGCGEHSFRFFGGKNDVITCVAMLDKQPGGTGGEATVTHGGVGYNHVVSNVTNKFSWDASYSMIVWGKEDPKHHEKCRRFKSN